VVEGGREVVLGRGSYDCFVKVCSVGIVRKERVKVKVAKVILA
jgi:hypothetical protein